MNTVNSGIHLNNFSSLYHEGLAGLEPEQGNNFMMNQGTGVLLIRRELKPKLAFFYKLLIMQ